MNPPLLRARWLPWLLVLSGATVLGLIDASQVQYDRALRGEPITWGHALIHGLPRWYAWAVLAPLILAVARRVDRARPGVARTLLLHLPAAVLITFLQVALFSGVSNALHGGVDPIAHLRPAFLKYAGLTYPGGLVTYALVVAGWYAWDLHRRFRERERAAARMDIHASRLKAQLAEARLKQLQSQLQPHFLFNTLHALSWLVLKGENTSAVRMITRLGELLRRSLRVSEMPEIPLGEELRLLEDYLAVQRLRFADRLQASVEAGEEVRGALVPTLLLQPLVENALRHGIEADPDARRVEVRAERRGDRLVVTVRNEGPGLGGERPAEGVGLRNTRARVESLHGEAAELRLEDVPGGVEVRVSFPFRVAEDAGDDERRAEAPDGALLRDAGEGAWR